MNGPGRRILYCDVELDGSYTLRLTVFYVNTGPFVSQETLDFEATAGGRRRDPSRAGRTIDDPSYLDGSASVGTRLDGTSESAQPAAAEQSTTP
jgi:hypothetical protein